jgi:pimeloyl-ACP methyl ester carboxylesterase
MPTVVTPSGAHIWYCRQGTGPTLLQIHGSAFGHRNFERLTPLLAESFDVIDFDLPGYGQSTGGALRPSIAELADEIREFINVIGYDKLNVHGTSFGAMIALTLAARHPGTIDSLILSCFLARYDSAARMMRYTWKRAAMDSGMEAVADLTSVAGFARSFYEQPWAQDQLAAMREAFSRTEPSAFVASTEAIEAADLSPLVRQVTARSLLIAGAEDNMTPFAPAASGIGMSAVARELPDCESQILPECGHYLVIERPAEAADLIRRFVTPATPHPDPARSAARPA